MEVINNKYDLLKKAKILVILNGTQRFGTIPINEYDEVICSMPYLSVENIISISKKLGFYNEICEFKDRNTYFKELLDYCINFDKVTILLNYLFSKENFENKLSGYKINTINYCMKKIINIVISEINSILYFDEVKVIRKYNKYYLEDINCKIKINSSNIKFIDRNYIINLYNRAMKDIDEKNYDSAITKARTLLEEVFIYAIEIKEEIPNSKGDIRKLFNQVKILYNMHQDKDTDKRINELLTGLEKILTAILEMRNKNSDSHGVGLRRIEILDYHARLFVNASITMSDFILGIVENKN